MADENMSDETSNAGDDLKGPLAPLKAVLETYDADVCAHGERVAALSAAIGELMELPEQAVADLRLGGRLHDIGLVGVSSDILQRPGALTIGEYDNMKSHCGAGFNILLSAGLHKEAASVALEHHERYDGSGYPNGLAGKEISVGARIVAVADTMAAMAYDRPHRDGYGVDGALAHIRDNAGTLFDPDVVKQCVHLFENGWAFPVRGHSEAVPHFQTKRPALRVAALFDHNPFPVVITDASMKVLDVNHAFSDVTGWAREDVVGKGPAIWHSERHGPSFFMEIWTDAGEHGRWRGQVWHRRRDGTEYPAHLDLVAVRNHEGLATDYVGVFTDLGSLTTPGDAISEFINELTRTNTELAGALSRAEAHSTAKSRFLASMSHELRTPLTAVIGFSDAILSGAFGELEHPTHLEYLENIRESGVHLLELITDMLDVSKIESGKFELHEEPVHIHRLAEVAMRLMRSRAESRRLKMEMNIPKSLPEVYVDERRMKEVLLNLLSNAVKFSHDGGEVWLEARREDTGCMTLVVSDAGIGMDPDEIPKALTPFGQIKNAWVRESEGTGLGLPLTKGLVELHGGKMEIASAVGEGTTVKVRIPAARVLG